MSYSHTSEEEFIGTRYKQTKRACDDPHSNFQKIRKMPTPELIPANDYSKKLLEEMKSEAATIAYKAAMVRFIVRFIK